MRPSSGGCAQTQHGQSTEMIELLPIRGGMFTISRLITPSVQACKCWQMASIANPSTNGVGSQYFQAARTNSYKSFSHSLRSTSSLITCLGYFDSSLRRSNGLLFSLRRQSAKLLALIINPYFELQSIIMATVSRINKIAFRRLISITIIRMIHNSAAHPTKRMIRRCAYKFTLRPHRNPPRDHRLNPKLA